MDTLSTIHFERIMPLLAQIGLENLAPLLKGGDSASLSEDAVRGLVIALSNSAQGRVLRGLVAVSRATSAELWAWESDKGAEAEALRLAALSEVSEVVPQLREFFGVFGMAMKDALAGLSVRTEAVKAD